MTPASATGFHADKPAYLITAPRCARQAAFAAVSAASSFRRFLLCKTDIRHCRLLFTLHAVQLFFNSEVSICRFSSRLFISMMLGDLINGFCRRGKRRASRC